VVDVVGQAARIPDVVLYLNGLPLVVVELKALEGGTIAKDLAAEPDDDLNEQERAFYDALAVTHTCPNPPHPASLRLPA
jgi:type I site-specific restriction-modification system R (restriction) subunit